MMDNQYNYYNPNEIQTINIRIRTAQTSSMGRTRREDPKRNRERRRQNGSRLPALAWCSAWWQARPSRR